MSTDFRCARTAGKREPEDTMRRAISGLCFAIFLAWCCCGARAQNDPGGKDAPRMMGDSDKELLAHVREAVAKGAGYLLRSQHENGSWTDVWAAYDEIPFPTGETSLTLLALLKSGCDPGDPRIGKGLDWLRAKPLEKTYDAAVLVQALAARHEPSAPAPAGAKELAAAFRAKLKIPEADLEWMKDAVRFLFEVRVASCRSFGADTSGAATIRDAWHYPKETGDHSNTVMALEALQTASRCGIAMPEEMWLAVVKHLIEVQEKEGPGTPRYRLEEDKKSPGHAAFKLVPGQLDSARGWCYSACVLPEAHKADERYAPTGSMTCAGVACMSIALSGLGNRCPKYIREPAEKALRDGIAWVALNFKADRNPGHPKEQWRLYYLWAVERAATLAYLRHFGMRDWYREGAELLLKQQAADGSWDDPVCRGAICNTCFALLFLTRATAPGRR